MSNTQLLAASSVDIKDLKSKYLELISNGYTENVALKELQFPKPLYLKLLVEDLDFISDVEQARKLRADFWVSKIAGTVEKRDSVAFQQNAISIKEDIDEIEVVPIDNTKPIVIAGKEYFNAAVKIKKTKREVVDSTKIAVAVSDYKQTEVSKEESTETYNKSVKKKINYFEYFWLPILLLLLFLAYKFRRLLPNPYSIISYICRTLKNQIK